MFQGRAQHGQGIGDIIRGAWRFFRPIIFNGTAAAFKAGGEAFKDGATVKERFSVLVKHAKTDCRNGTGYYIRAGY